MSTTTVFSTPGAHAEHFALGLGRLVELLARLMRALLALLRGTGRRPRPLPDRERLARDFETRRAAERILDSAFTTTVLHMRA